MLAAQADTTVTVRGLLGAVIDRSHTATWVLALPAPVRYRDRIVGEVELTGNERLWSRFDRGFVEVQGTLTAAGPNRPTLSATKVREVMPEGLARREVSTSFSQRTVASLFVLPRSIRWRDAAGQSTGVGPVLVYSLNNHGQSQLSLDFNSQDYVCFTLRRRNDARWRWQGSVKFTSEPLEFYKLKLPAFVRETLSFNEDAAPVADKYSVRAGLCGYPEYQVETDFEIVR